MQQGHKKAPAAGKKTSGQWTGSGWGEEEIGWVQVGTTGSEKTESDSVPHHREKQEFETWHNPLSDWRIKTNEIIVDTKDKEAWPSIGNQSEEASEAGDIDNASVKSGSVISSSSNPGQGQGQDSICVVGSSAIQGQCASSVWGASTSSIEENIDSNSTVWGITSPGTSAMNSVGWSNIPTHQNAAVMNQGQHMNMQSNPHSAMSSMSDTITSSNPLSSSNSSGGWGAMNNAVSMGSANGPQNSMQQELGGGAGSTLAPSSSSGAQLATNGPQLVGGPTSGASQQPGHMTPGSTQSWQKQSNQDTSWNSIRGNSGELDKAGSAEMPMDSDTNQWGASPAPAGSSWGNPNPAANGGKQNFSGWGNPSPNPIGSSEWGQPSKSSNPVGGAWGSDNGSAHGQWGSGNPSAAAAGTNKVQSSAPNSWAQAAGKGLNIQSSKVPSPLQSAASLPAAPTREDLIKQVIDSNEGWGKVAVRQDSSWDVDEDIPPKKEDDNVWNQSNDGTAIWESSKENSASWNKPEQHKASQQWQDNKDSKMWNGPPDNQSQWGGPPKDMPPNNGGNGQWNNQMPNQWSGNHQQHNNNNTSQWGANNQQASGNNWGGPPQGNQGGWGNMQGPPSVQGQQPPVSAGSGWNNPTSQSSSSVGWGGQQQPQQQNQQQPPMHQGSGWGMQMPNKSSGNWGSSSQQQNPNNWGSQLPPQSNVQNSWDNSGGSSNGNWGNSSEKGASGQGSWGHNGNSQNGSWGGNGGNRMDTGSWGNQAPPTAGPGGGWGDAGADVKPMGWNEPSPPTHRRSSEIDNGTQYWGDPTSQSKPCQNWSTPSTPSTPLTPGTPQPAAGLRQKPDDKAGWGQPPSNKNSGWGEPSPPTTSIDDGTAIWNQQSQAKSTGWMADGYAAGAKPKSTSSWGDHAEWNPNTAKKMGDSGWDDGSSSNVFDDTDMGDWDTQQEASSWSSAPGWNKGPKKIIKGANKFGVGVGGPLTNHMSMLQGANKLGLGGSSHPQMRSKLLQQLMDMGFKREDAQNALISNNMNLESAISDLVTSANRAREMDVDPSIGHKGIRGMRGGLADDISDGMSDAQLAQMSMQGASAFSATAAMLGGKPAVPSLSSSLAGLSGGTTSNQTLQQQKYMTPPIVPTAGGSGNQPMRGGQGGNQLAAALSVQQQLVQQQIVQQLRMAVQAGLISPQLLHQELPPQVLVLLQQLLQHQNTLQRLVAQQQMVQQSKTANPMQQHQQLEQIGMMIQRIKQQILQLQQQIQAAHQSLAKTPTSLDPSMPGIDPLKGLTADFSSLSVAKDMSQPPPLNPQQGSRLTKLWKLPSPEKDLLEVGVSTPTSEMLNRAVGSKPIQQSHSAPNLQSRNDVPSSLSIGGNSTWSNQVPPSSSSNDWPTSSAISMPTSQSDSKDINDKESLTANNAALNAAAAAAANNSFNLNDMIPEFVPGKPWTGFSNKSIEDDEHITPGSAKLESRLSVSTIKVEDVMTTLGKSSTISSVDTLTSGANTSSWSSFPRSNSVAPVVGPPGGRPSSWGQHTSDSVTPTTLSTELWGVPVPKNISTRPPPGLTNQGKSGMYNKPSLNHSMSWAPGENSAYRQGSGWGGQPVTSWLILKNLTPQIDGSTLRLLCTQHGPLQTFYLSLNYGQALVRYKTCDEAIKAQKSLNTCVLGNTTILAEFATESDIERLISQQQNAHSNQTSGSSAFSRSTSHHYSSKGDASHWNGASMGGFTSSMWGTGSSLWSTPVIDDHNLLPGDLLGPTM